MLTRLKLTGFRSFKELDLPLGPLTVLIGPNGSGKSNLMDFFALVSEAAGEKLSEAFFRRGGMPAVLWAGGMQQVSWKFEMSQLDFPPEGQLGLLYQVRCIGSTSIVASEVASVVLSAEQGPETVFKHGYQESVAGKKNLDESELGVVQLRGPGLHPAIDYLRRFMAGVTVYREFATHENAPMRLAQLAKPETRLRPGGDNLVNVLHQLSQRPRYREYYERLLEILRLAFPTFKNLYFPSEVGAGKITMSWEDAAIPGHEFPVEQLSDGLLRFLCLAAICLSPDPPPLICIDEPELGLHPALLGLVAGLLQEACERTQLIVATHSPQLVNHLKPEEIAITEMCDGATQIRRLESDELTDWLRDFTLGDLWLMGELGGRT